MQPNAEYHGGDNIFVPVGNQVNDSVRLHELSHQFLMKSTRWGTMTYLQTQLRHADRCYQRLEHHLSIGDILMQAAERTFESHAILHELLALRAQDNINEIIDSLYYKIYNTLYFDTFRILSTTAQSEATHSEIVHLSNQLPQLALAVDLFPLETKIWNSPKNLMNAIMKAPRLYHPDTRFDILVDACVELLKEFAPIQITDKMLADKSGLCVIGIEHSTYPEMLGSFSHAMSDNFPADECIRDAFKLISESVVMGDIEEIFENGMLTDLPLPAKDVEIMNLTRMEPWVHECDVLIVMPYHEIVLLQYCKLEQRRKYVCLCEWQALSIFLAKFAGTVVLYEDDYDYMNEKYPEIFQYRPFFYLEGTFHIFKEKMKENSAVKPQAGLFLVDDSTSCLFIKRNDASLLFTVQNRGGTMELFNDIFNGKFDFSPTECDYFFCDDNDEKCSNAIKAVLNISKIKGRCSVNTTRIDTTPK